MPQVASEPPGTRSIDDPEGSVRSLTRALLLLRIIAREGGNQGFALAELSQHAALHKSTVYRLASVLVREGFLLRSAETERYRLGLAALELGSSYLNNLTLRQEALPLLQSLMAQADETVHLGVRDSAEVFYIEKVQAPANVIVHTRVGQRESVHTTSLGKAILAFAGPEAIEEVIAHGLPAKTSRTITDPRKFRTALNEVRRKGYAVNREENRLHINAVAAPVFDHAGRPVAGIAISGLAQRLPVARLHELGALVAAAAGEVSRRMGYVRDA